MRYSKRTFILENERRDLDNKRYQRNDKGDKGLSILRKRRKQCDFKG